MRIIYLSSAVEMIMCVKNGFAKMSLSGHWGDWRFSVVAMATICHTLAPPLTTLVQSKSRPVYELIFCKRNIQYCSAIAKIKKHFFATVRAITRIHGHFNLLLLITEGFLWRPSKVQTFIHFHTITSIYPLLIIHLQGLFYDNFHAAKMAFSPR